MPEGMLDNTEEILKRLLINIEAFKRLERNNQKLQQILLSEEAAKKADYRIRVEQAVAEAGKKESETKKVAKEAIDKFRKANEFLVRELETVQRKNSFLSKKYIELSNLAKKLNYDNKLMKSVLMKNNSEKNTMNEKVLFFTKKLEEKHELSKLSYKNLVKEHELSRLELERKFSVEKKRADFHDNREKALIDAFDKAKNDYNRSRKINEALLPKILMLQKESLANEKVLNARTELIKNFFEKKLKELAKTHIDKEIDYKTRIESMSKDLAKYYEELKNSKQKYFMREKEIREKIKKIFD